MQFENVSSNLYRYIYTTFELDGKGQDVVGNFQEWASSISYIKCMMQI
jgi:hypothetical protein